MSDDRQERRLSDKRAQAMLEQAMNAGFDFDTVEGRNDYRSTLEFSKRQMRRCEKVNGELTKYGVLLIAAGAVSLLMAGVVDWVKTASGVK